jgi:hypothetical protein
VSIRYRRPRPGDAPSPANPQTPPNDKHKPDAPLAAAPVEPDTPPKDGDANAEAPPKQEHRVGYKSPPLHSRFQPGQSGNRKGRPKGSRNWSTIMEEAASRPRTIGVGGKKVRMCTRTAVAEQLSVNAIKGDKAARKDFLNEMHRLAGSAPAAPSGDETAPTPEALNDNDKALLEDFFRRTAKVRGEEP